MKIPIAGIAPLSKSLIQVKGQDASKFLNGLITSRLLPNTIKKKQYTISDAENKHANLVNIIDPHENWGLMHEDIYDPDNEIQIRRDGISSMFLNSKGRVVNDCFLYANPFHNLKDKFESNLKDPNILVEVDETFGSRLLSLLKIHKLSAKVKIKKQESLYSYYYYNDTVEFDEWIDNLQAEFHSSNPQEALEISTGFVKSGKLFNTSIVDHIVGFAVDNRIPNFGIKVLTDIPVKSSEFTGESINVDNLFSDSFKSQFPFTLVSEEVIKQRRFVNGLFETQDAPPDTSLLPFECNLDYVNGLSLDKGCYVGQELTIRTFNNGIIRKRIVPVQFFKIGSTVNLDQPTFNPSDPVLEDIKHINGSTIAKLNVTPLEEVEEQPEPEPVSSSPFGSSKPIRKRKSTAGKLLSIQDNLGFILIGLSEIERTELYKIQIPCLDGVKEVGVKVFKPDWWPVEDEEM